MRKEFLTELKKPSISSIAQQSHTESRPPNILSSLGFQNSL